MVVDDTRNVQLMLQEYLQNQGFEICLAYDGVEAMEIFHEFEMTLSGVEFVRRSGSIEAAA